MNKLPSAVIDTNCLMFAQANDYVELVETDFICNAIADDFLVVPSDGRDSEPLICLRPPLYYTLANGIADNRRINDRLLEISSSCGGKMFGVAEPKYEGAAREEIRRIAALGAAGVVWSPRAQGVFADDPHVSDLVEFVAGLGLVSLIQTAPYSINESLMRIWHLAACCPAVPIVVLGALASWENVQAIQQNRGGPENLRYDISGVSAARDLSAVVTAMGADRLLFGSGGVKYFQSTLDLVDRCALGAPDREAILAGNAARLLAIEWQ